ncbi:hypothetical protein ABBQ32_006687 [Trebouxia sp. C0010 RCD-2024]
MATACLSNTEKMVRISKEMSFLLRHKPPPGMTSDGYMPLPALLTHMKQRPSEQEVRSVVACDAKKRYTIDDSTNPARIRANQGHSYEVQDLELQPITDASQVPFAVHVTGRQGLEAIQKTGEIRRMARTHIHFASEACHMRANAWANVLLKLDLEKALKEGYKFFRSSNGVVLTEGPIPVKLLMPVTKDEVLTRK